MVPSKSGDLGNWGERRAVSYLEDQGWTIESCNYSTSFGECDIIGWDRDTLVFVEVKTRRGQQFGRPEQAVTRDKRDHIRRVARAFLADRDDEVSCRFDVVAIEMKQPDLDAEIRHIQHAFEGRE